MIDPLDLFYYILVSIVGLCLGSFATALIHRIPRNIPWIYDRSSKAGKACRSACPSCHRTLTARDLVPVFSWLCSRGKCRHCAAPVSIRYPLVELATMVAALVQFHVWGVSFATIPVLLSVPFLIAALVIDWENMILPNDINIALAILAIAFVLCRFYEGSGGIGEPVLAAIILTAMMLAVSWLLSKWKGRSVLGWGDIKFLPSAGLFIGFWAMPSFLVLSGALGIVTALIKQKITQKQVFPFGPALIISLYIHVFLTGLGFDYKW